MSKLIKKAPLKPVQDMLILGADMSLNGAGLLLMKNYNIVDYKFFTTVKKVAAEHPGVAFFNNTTGPARIEIVSALYRSMLKEDIDYMAIEDYALGATSNSTYQIGELGGVIRLMTWQNNVPFREYEPSKIKLYATGNGNAEKSQMVLQAYKMGFDVGQYGKSGEDLADAFWIAHMMTTELKIRQGEIDIDIIPAARRNAFTNTTKAFPTPIINRPFISRGG